VMVDGDVSVQCHLDGDFISPAPSRENLLFLRFECPEEGDERSKTPPSQSERDSEN